MGILIVAGLVAFTLYYCVPSTNRGRRGSSRGSGGFGGGSWGGGPGGGDNGGDVGPPPGSGDCPPSGRQVPPQSQQQSGPGFWSGFGTGALLSVCADGLLGASPLVSVISGSFSKSTNIVSLLVI